MSPLLLICLLLAPLSIVCADESSAQHNGDGTMTHILPKSEGLHASGADTSKKSSKPKMETEGTSVSTMSVVMDLLTKILAYPLRIVGRALVPALELPFHIVQAIWSLIGPGTTVPGMTPMGGRMLSTGLLAGLASRIVEIDFLGLSLRSLKIEAHCHKKVACEMGAYVAHTNRLLHPILASTFETLFKSTTKYWEPMQKGLTGQLCHELYPSCIEDFLMKR